jgi:hypothetical protein
LVKTFRMCASLLPVRGVILNPFFWRVQFTLHAASCVGAALHLVFDVVCYVAEFF